MPDYDYVRAGFIDAASYHEARITAGQWAHSHAESERSEYPWDASPEVMRDYLRVFPGEGGAYPDGMIAPELSAREWKDSAEYREYVNTGELPFGGFEWEIPQSRYHEEFMDALRDYFVGDLGMDEREFDEKYGEK